MFLKCLEVCSQRRSDVEEVRICCDMMFCFGSKKAISWQGLWRHARLNESDSARPPPSLQLQLAINFIFPFSSTIFNKSCLPEVSNLKRSTLSFK